MQVSTEGDKKTPIRAPRGTKVVSEPGSAAASRAPSPSGEEKKVVDVTPYKIIYSGVKRFFRPLRQISVDFVLHRQTGCLEVISYDPEIEVEAHPRLHLVYKEALKRATAPNTDYAVKLERVLAAARSREGSKQSVNSEAVTRALQRQCVVQYVLARLTCSNGDEGDSDEGAGGLSFTVGVGRLPADKPCPGNAANPNDLEWKFGQLLAAVSTSKKEKGTVSVARSKLVAAADEDIDAPAALTSIFTSPPQLDEVTILRRRYSEDEEDDDLGSPGAPGGCIDMPFDANSPAGTLGVRSGRQMSSASTPGSALATPVVNVSVDDDGYDCEDGGDLDFRAGGVAAGGVGGGILPPLSCSKAMASARRSQAQLLSELASPALSVEARAARQEQLQSLRHNADENTFIPGGHR